ncbi:9831_t:CDS:2, partial [Dentiscutata erythropus]
YKDKTIFKEWWKIPKDIHEIIAQISDNYNYDNNLNESSNKEEDNYNSADSNIDEENGSATSSKDIEDNTSEESEDFSLIEFNSYEIKNKISNLITKYPYMPTITRIICDNIQKQNLSLRDLLPNGIVNYSFLRLYNYIFEQDCFEALLWSKAEQKQYKTNLTNDEKNFICNHIKHRYYTAPNKLLLYKKKSPKINESSYSFQVVKSICDLLLYNIKGINIEYNGPSESTQNRNRGKSGPTCLPDLMVSKSFMLSNYKWEFMFCE